jgi:RecB family exonuclease
LFYVAVTRARERLLVTAVAGEEQQPSRFLDELDPLDGERPLTPAQRGVHLPALVAELRAVATDPATDDLDRRGAAVELGRLADAGVPGADPDGWWGLAGVSTAAPVADPGLPVPVSPSRLESFLNCELRSLLADLGARDGDQVAASLGTVIHDLAATAPPGTGLAEFERLLDEHWAALDFGAPWFSVNERARATGVLKRLVDWLRDSRAEFSLVGVEEGFGVEVGDARISGRVDRLERDHDGRLVVVDLKTGKSKPRSEDVPHHPQLAAYQFAVDNGAFTQGDRAGGALLVQLGASGDVTQRQPSLSEAADPGWVGERIGDVAARMRGSEFTAIVSSDCGRCDVRVCCPLQADGGQVTS